MDRRNALKCLGVFAGAAAFGRRLLGREPVPLEPPGPIPSPVVPELPEPPAQDAARLVRVQVEGDPYLFGIDVFPEPLRPGLPPTYTVELHYEHLPYPAVLQGLDNAGLRTLLLDAERNHRAGHTAAFAQAMLVVEVYEASVRGR